MLDLPIRARRNPQSNSTHGSTIAGAFGSASVVAVAFAMDTTQAAAAASIGEAQPVPSEVKGMKEGPGSKGGQAERVRVFEVMEGTVDVLKRVQTYGALRVPVVKEMLDVGLSAITLCEDLKGDGGLGELRNRIAKLLLAAVKLGMDTRQDEPTFRIIHEELKIVKECLAAISASLAKIKQHHDSLLRPLLIQSDDKTFHGCVDEIKHCMDRCPILRSTSTYLDLSRTQEELVLSYGGLEEERDHDIQIVSEEIHGMKANVDHLEHAVDELKAMITTTKPKHHTFHKDTMPDIPEGFCGREALVNRIVDNLASRDKTRSRVCILGPGGMGKTSAAVAVMHHPKIKETYADHHCYWVSCIGATSPTAFLSHLAEQLCVTVQSGRHTLSTVVEYLQETEDPQVIVLDHFESTWHSAEGSQEAVKKILRSLSTLSRVAILVTMRSGFAPLDSWVSEHLMETTLEDSRQIYTSLHPSSHDHTNLDKLLDALGHHPYAISLMASYAKQTLSRPDQLLEEWNRRGTAMLSTPMGGLDKSIQQSLEDPFFSHIPRASEVLQILSLLPAGVSNLDLQLWTFSSDVIDVLRDTALVVNKDVELDGQKQTRLSAVPIVRTYLRHGRISEQARNEVYRTCFNHLCNHAISFEGPNEPNFKAVVEQLRSDETNIHWLVTEFVRESLEEESIRDPRSLPFHIDGLLTFCWYRYFTHQHPEPALPQSVVELARKAKDTRREAEALFCLAQTHYKGERFDDARDTFQRTRKLVLSFDSHHVLACRSELAEMECLQKGGGGEGGKC